MLLGKLQMGKQRGNKLCQQWTFLSILFCFVLTHVRVFVILAPDLPLLFRKKSQ